MVIYYRYPLYVQAIPGSASPMIYSAVVGAGGATGAPQLVQWKATSSAAAHHPGVLCVQRGNQVLFQEIFLCVYELLIDLCDN